MIDFSIALLIGFLSGFFGAIPPGPMNVTIIRHASQGRVREAFRVALGGSLVDTAICAFIALGLGWILERVVGNRWVKGSLALFLLAYGLKILVLDRKRNPNAESVAGGQANGTPSSPRPAHGSPLESLAVPNGGALAAGMPFLIGVVQGAVNPALFVNWTLFIGFAVGHGLLRANYPSSAGFALGVGLGVFGWFGLVIELTERLRNHRFGVWIRNTTALAGVLLVGFGLYFSWKSAQEFLPERPNPAQESRAPGAMVHTDRPKR